MKISVIGSGCTNCKKLLQNTQDAVNQLNIDAEIIYVTDLMEIAKTGILRTPGLMIDGKIVLSGKVATSDEVIVLINQNK